MNLTDSSLMQQQQHSAGNEQHRKGSDQFSLDDLIYEMESRPNANNPKSNGESGVFSANEGDQGCISGTQADIYAQLEQKERDLVLAAELGKALLDKNEDLSRQNERIAEEFSMKLEVRPVIAFYLFACPSLVIPSFFG